MTIGPLSPGDAPLYERLADHIADEISAGRIVPGSRLPTLRALAVDLGTTVGTVGRAYDLLQRRGLVDAAVGRGTYVRHEQAVIPVVAPPESAAAPPTQPTSIERLLAEIVDHLAAIRAAVDRRPV